MGTDTTVLRGADSTDANELPSGLEFYCYYTAGIYANEAAVRKNFPRKLYVGITAIPGNITGADVIDMESGAWTAEQVRAYLPKMEPPNLNLPGIYCSADNVGKLEGIPRNLYYLFQADWDGITAVPRGADLAQYADKGSYDLDVAYAYVFRKPVVAFPAHQTGVVHSTTTGGSANVITDDGGRTWVYAP